MPNVKPYIDEFGLINSRPDEFNAKNALLWTVENYFLTRSETIKNVLIRAIEADRQHNMPGIFDNNPAHVLDGPDKYMTHDQLTAICTFSYFNKLDYHKEIWTEAKRQLFRYDNVDPINPSWNRILHPRDIIYYAYLNRSIIGYLGIPILMIMFWISCKFSMETSGKLLVWTRLQAVKDTSLIWRLFYAFITTIIEKRFGNWENVFKVYFPNNDQPNRIPVIY